MKVERYDSGNLIITDITDPDLIEAFETYAPIDVEHFRILKRKPWSIDVKYYWDRNEIRPFAEEIIRQYIFEHPEKYGEAECIACESDIEMTDYAWVIDGRTYCEQCANDKFRGKAEEDIWCGKCGTRIAEGDDVWTLPGEDPMCDGCAVSNYRHRLWWHWLLET